MPPGLIEHDHCVGARCDRLGNFREMERHRGGVAFRQDQPGGLALGGADGAEQPSRLGPLIERSRGAATAWPSGQVLQPPPYHTVNRWGWSLVDDRRQRPTMFITQQWRLPRRLAGQQANRPLGIERQHPVPNNLTANSPRLRCLAARPALVDYSKRQKAPRLPGVVDRRANPRTCSAV